MKYDPSPVHVALREQIKETLDGMVQHDIVVPVRISSGFFNWGRPASLTSQILYLITTLDHLELGVVGPAFPSVQRTS